MVEVVDLCLVDLEDLSCGGPGRYCLLVVPIASVGTFIDLRWMTLRLAAREHSVAKVLDRLIPNAYSLDSRVYAVVLKSI